MHPKIKEAIHPIVSKSVKYPMRMAAMAHKNKTTNLFIAADGNLLFLFSPITDPIKPATRRIRTPIEMETCLSLWTYHAKSMKARANKNNGM